MYIGKVVLIHGYGEHPFRPQYNKLAKDIGSAGWEVHRHRIKGHWDGSDAEPDFHFDSFEEILRDLREHTERLRCELPLIIIGKSLGGLLAIRLLQEYPHLAEGAVALSPCLELGPKYDTSWKRLIAYILVDYLYCPRASNPRDILDPSDVALNYDDYVRDPMILSKGICAGIAVTTRNETFLAMQCTELKKPLLILHGGDDKICIASASERLATTSDTIQCHIYPEARHDLLDDTDEVKEDLLERIKEFLLQVCPVSNPHRSMLLDSNGLDEL